MLNEEFLKGLLGNEDVSADDKVRQIVAEYNADIIGLKKKNEELLGKESKFKEQIASFESGKAELDAKVASLEGALEKASADGKGNKDYYDGQLRLLEEKHATEMQKVTVERDFYKQSHLKSLRDKAIDAGIKDLNFIDGLKDGFVARVLSMNEFEPKEIDGEIKFLDRTNHTIEDAISAFALTSEGKAYIRNPSTGGGARGSGAGAGLGNAKVVTRQQLENMNPQQQSDFFAKGGEVTD